MTESKQTGEKWISVDERLPPEGEWVLCAMDDGIFCYTCMNINGKLYGHGSPSVEDRVTHWMPLPEPPK